MELSESTREFLADVFDGLPDAAQVSEYIHDGKLDMHAMFTNRVLVDTLAFRLTYRSVLKTHAPRELVFRFFIESAAVGRPMTPSSFIAFIASASPAFRVMFPKFVSPDTVKKEMESARSVLSASPQNVKRALIIKFAERYLGGGDELFLATNLSADVLDANIMATYRMIREKTTMPAQDFIDECRTMNPFSGYVTAAETRMNGQNHSHFDQVAQRLLEDGAFFLKMMGCHAVYWWDSDNSDSKSLLAVVLETIDAHIAPNESILVFTNSSSPPKGYKFNVNVAKVPSATKEDVERYMALLPAVCASFTIVSANASDPLPAFPLCTNVAACSVVATHDHARALSLPKYGRVIPFDSREGDLREADNTKVQLLPFPTSTTTPSDPRRDPLFVRILLHRRMFGEIPSKNPIDAFHEFVSKYFLALAVPSSSAPPPTSSTPPPTKNDYAVVVVDNRSNIMNVLAIKATQGVLRRSSKHGWDSVVFTRPDETDYRFYKDRIEDVKVVPVHDMPEQKRFSMSFYNELLKSEKFWENLVNYRRVLLVQDDGFLVRNGDIDGFLKYDYVGAPWDPVADYNKYMRENPRYLVSPNFVGNGGLSLRNPSAMLELICAAKGEAKALHHDGLQPEPEDVFFAKMCVRHNKSIPALEDAKKFASEEIMSMDSMGFHKVWAYHSPADAERFFDSAVSASTSASA